MCRLLNTLSAFPLHRVHGLKSGKMLKEFVGHTSYVNDAIYSPDGSQIISAASDSTVRVWDAKSCEELRAFKCAAAVQHSVPLIFDGAARSRPAHLYTRCMARHSSHNSSRPQCRMRAIEAFGVRRGPAGRFAEDGV